MKTRLIHLVIYSAVFMLCGAPSISFDAKFPAQKPLPEHIKTIAIIDRSARESKLANIIEGGITGEGIGQDKEASRRLLDGITAQLTNSGRYSIIRTNEEMVIKQGPREFSAPLTVAEIKGYCIKYKADAVLSLEYFDTDHIADRMVAHIGVRIYDGVKNEIIEEFTFTNSINIARRNDDIINLVTNFTSREVIMNLSYDSGIMYGQRISPYWLRVVRKYYKRSKGNNDFAYGARMMEVNDWDPAIQAFETCIGDKNRKTLGRASHNLAVIHEILGDYEKAHDYAQQAWGKYRNKSSREYAHLLSLRIAEIQRLRDQGE